MEKTDKKTDILRAAETLFAELGFEGTSTRQIAKESGANMAMINYYFGSKEGVFLEIMEDRICGFKSQLNQINDEQIPAKEKLLKVVEQYVTRIFSNITFHKMMHRELSLTQRPEMFGQIKDAMASNRMVIEKIIENGIAEGSFRNVDVRMSILTIMGTISMVAISPTKAEDNIDMNDEKQKEVLRKRLVAHLQDFIITHLTKPTK
ncbi:TetR/AcrR family transcriptional regulator [Pedobacter frigiditerrae]|uniref:TetR/AcrR family transcriptional regulator n=1 Tax=Pedobacter frigiditerrae TaxID=2530452 RepID=A0A4R0N6E1_9SPHI|nr:TetR family transcriptional regulator [Pedobacter frigiditerrae]TCC93834.1 TetR/AcrR family transcriptional regulator [Pedobacter frigiditerrae]